MRVYEKEFKEEAMKLSYEIGIKATSEQLGISEKRIPTWKNRPKTVWRNSVCR